MSTKLAEGMKFDQMEHKLRFDLIPPEAEEELAKVYTYGALKYAPNSWQKVDGGLERYTAALQRHLNKFRQGKDADPDFGIHHMAHAAWCTFAILWFLKKEGRLPKGLPFEGIRKKFEAQRKAYLRAKKKPLTRRKKRR